MLGRHMVGKASLGTAKVRGMTASASPIRVRAAMSWPIRWDPGAIAAPTKAIVVETTSRAFCACNKSDADFNMLQKIACTRTTQFGSQV